MTKKLEELLNIAPADDSTEAPPEIHPEEQKEQAMEVVEKVEHELKEVDTIESALAGVENLTANDKEMDDIAKKSEDSFNNLMDFFAI